MEDFHQIKVTSFRLTNTNNNIEIRTESVKAKIPLEYKIPWSADK